MTANKQAWDDLDFIEKVYQAKGYVEELGRIIDNLLKQKEDILDDATRKAELKKVLDQHHNLDFKIPKIDKALTKLKALYTWLETNNYL